MNFLNNHNCSGRCVALGNFDGLHKGHMAVLNAALSAGGKPAVLLFDRHPMQVLKGQAPPLIISEATRDEMLAKMGFEIIKIPFDSFRNMSPEDFITFLKEKLNAKSVSAGFNFRFGKNAAASADDLNRNCRDVGICCSIANEVRELGEAVSSTSIRNAIKNGEIEKANVMLGRNFSVEGEVIHGDSRGRTLDFPTINQKIDDNIICPKFGAYAAAVKIDGKNYPAAANIGVRPTIGTNIKGVESHIIGFSGDLYGRTIKVELLSFLREERDFKTLEALKNQLEKDAEEAKAIFRSQFSEAEHE